MTYNSAENGAFVKHLEQRLNGISKVVLIDCFDENLVHRLVEKCPNNIAMCYRKHEMLMWNTASYLNIQEAEACIDLYSIYDFSDKITIVSDSNQNGSLLNYVKTGILTMEEMADAILYQSETS